VDLALLDAHVHMLSYLAADYLNGDLVPERYADSAHPYIVPSQRFATVDGDIVTMPMADHMWRAACEALELEELGADPELGTAPGRLANRERVIVGFAEAVARHTTAAVVELLEGVGVPVAPVNSVPEILADPQIEARGLVVEGDGVKMLGNPIKMSDLDEGPYGRAPHVGEHTRELLLATGMDTSEVDALWPTS
ncbi:MAG: CoA transferase, partial [Gaiellaceae bacterium]